MIALMFQLGWIIGGVLDTLIGTRWATVVAGGGSTVIVTFAFVASRELRRVK